MAFGRDGQLSTGTPLKNPRQVMQEELGRDEKLLWADIPIFPKSHAISAIPKALFGIPFFAFAVFWTWMAASITGSSGGLGPAGFDLFFPMFGIPFMLIGLGMMLSPLWEIKKAKHVTYAVTDKRLIIRQGFPKIKIKSWPLSKIGTITRDGPAEGPGSVYFAEEVHYGGKGSRTVEKIGFIGIDGPKRLADLMREHMDG